MVTFTSDLIKLIVILVGGLLIGGIGQYLIIKNKKQKSKKGSLEYSNNNYSSQNQKDISQENETAKNYITNYKYQYSRESIKQGLMNSGISEVNAEQYLKKYL
ncbi:MAG: hypothetical protein ACOC16_00790 [Nanoarchaeota archaeon]